MSFYIKGPWSIISTALSFESKKKKVLLWALYNLQVHLFFSSQLGLLSCSAVLFLIFVLLVRSPLLSVFLVREREREIYLFHALLFILDTSKLECRQNLSLNFDKNQKRYTLEWIVVFLPPENNSFFFSFTGCKYYVWHHIIMPLEP